MRKKLGEILLSSGVVTQADLDLALGDQMGGEPARLGDLLVSLGRISPAQLARALSSQHAIPFVQLPPVPADVLLAVPFDFQAQHRLVPFRVTGDSISVAMADPSDVDAIEELRVSLNRKVNRYVAATDEIDALHASVTGAVVDLPSVAPSIASVARGASPTATDLFGSLDLDAAPSPAALGDELFSGLGLSLSSSADVPPLPPEASVASPEPFELTPLDEEPAARRRSSSREEEEPEFFEAKPIIHKAPPPPPPPRILPTPAPAPAPAAASSFELGELQVEALEPAALISSPSATFDLTSAIVADPVSAPSPGSFEAPISETFDDAGTTDSDSDSYEIISEPSDEFNSAPVAEASGDFEVSVSENSGDFGAPAAAPVLSSAVAGDSFGADEGAPEPVAGAFSTMEEDAVSFEELPFDSTMEPLSPGPEPFSGEGETVGEQVSSDAPQTGVDDLFASPPPPPEPGLDPGELFSDAPQTGVDDLFAPPPPPPEPGLDPGELFSDAPQTGDDALFAAPPPPAAPGLDAGELFSDTPPADLAVFAEPPPAPGLDPTGLFPDAPQTGADDLFATPASTAAAADEPGAFFADTPVGDPPLAQTPEPEPDDAIIVMEDQLPEAPPAAPEPESLPSWLGSAAAPAAEAQQGFVLHPGEWTGKLDDTPPSRLVVGAVKALIRKGLLTEAEILEGLGKEP